MKYGLTHTPTLLHVLGPQGSGKGTQVELLNAELEQPLPVVTMGEIFREEMKQETTRGREVESIMGPGNKVYAKLWEEVLRDYLPRYDLTKGAILDGVVRDLDQYHAFERIRTELTLPEPSVLEIQVPEEESVKRLLLRGRHDDTEEGIRKRLKWSRDDVQPVIELFRSNGRVVTVDGLGTIDEIHQRVMDELVAANILTSLSS